MSVLPFVKKLIFYIVLFFTETIPKNFIYYPNEIKKLKCFSCGKKFQRMWSAKRHRPYLCKALKSCIKFPNYFPIESE